MEISIRTITQTLDIRSGSKQPRVIKRLLRKSLRKSRKRIIRYGLLTANVAILVAVISFVVKSPSTGESSGQNSLVSASSETTTSPLDQLSSADIAAHVARATNLAEVNSVENTADSYRSQLTITSEDKVLAKPQIIANALPSNKDIKRYKTQEGDTISAVATKFSVTSDSIRWSNNLSGDAVASGKELIIPPVTGIVYKVKAGDTPEKLAEKYRANKEQIIAINDAEVGGLIVGREIVIPDAVQPVAPTTVSGGYNYGIARGVIMPAYGANGYDYGYCTWHVANRRKEIGKPIPSNLGNAATWYSRAQSMGLSTGTQPQAGAILWHTNTRLAGGLGHVGYVEKMNDDGSILVSDMNYPIWGRVTYRTIQASEFSNYRFVY